MSNRPAARKHDYTAIFEWIVAYFEAHSYAPTFSEIGEACHIPSNSTVKYILEDLERQGLIELPEKRSRGIVVVGGQWRLVRQPNPTRRTFICPVN